MPVPAYTSNDTESHAHSPRRRPDKDMVIISGRTRSDGHDLNLPRSSMKQENRDYESEDSDSSIVMSDVVHDPFNANTCFDWFNQPALGFDGTYRSDFEEPSKGQARKLRMTNTDISMPDYLLGSHDYRGLFPDSGFPTSYFEPDKCSVESTKVSHNPSATNLQECDDSIEGLYH